MTIENGKVVIPAFYETETEEMLEVMRKQGIGVSKCYICGTKIEKGRRHPNNFREKFQALFGKKKFYDWNISGVSAKGVICGKSLCFWEALHSPNKPLPMNSVQKV